MLHDETVYKDPSRFNPDRFISRDGGRVEQDPREIAFGFGRRYDIRPPARGEHTLTFVHT
jgi:cytochrome P450